MKPASPLHSGYSQIPFIICALIKLILLQQN